MMLTSEEKKFLGQLESTCYSQIGTEDLRSSPDRVRSLKFEAFPKFSARYIVIDHVEIQLIWQKFPGPLYREGAVRHRLPL